MGEENTQMNGNTSQQVNNSSMNSGVQTTYAGFWIRALAVFLDGLILIIPISILVFILTFATGITQLNYLSNIVPPVILIFMEGTKGGGPGKLILGLRVVNKDGKYIGVGGAILRYIGKILSGIILGIGYIMAAFDSKKQGLHDKIAATYVVKK